MGDLCSHRIFLGHIVVEKCREQRALPAVDTFNKALHRLPRKSQGILTRKSQQMQRFHTTRANSRPEQEQQRVGNLRLLDHIICPQNEASGYFMADGLSSLQIEHQLKSCRLLDWKLARFGAAQYLH